MRIYLHRKRKTVASRRLGKKKRRRVGFLDRQAWEKEIFRPPGVKRSPRSANTRHTSLPPFLDPDFRGQGKNHVKLFEFEITQRIPKKYQMEISNPFLRSLYSFKEISCGGEKQRITNPSLTNSAASGKPFFLFFFARKLKTERGDIPSVCLAGPSSPTD